MEHLQNPENSKFRTTSHKEERLNGKGHILRHCENVKIVLTDIYLNRKINVQEMPN